MYKIHELERGIFNVKIDSIAAYCRKEKELKSSGGRCFMKQTYLKRLVQTYMEKNLAEKILLLFKETTMILSEIELLKR